MLLHTRLHIFHSSENYWLGYVNSPATRPTTYIHFLKFHIKSCTTIYLQLHYNYNYIYYNEIATCFQGRKLVLTICDTANGRIACTLMATSNICEAIIRPCLVPSILVNSTSTLTYLEYICIETITFNEA